eukprot:158624_1
MNEKILLQLIITINSHTAVDVIIFEKLSIVQGHGKLILTDIINDENVITNLICLSDALKKLQTFPYNDSLLFKLVVKSTKNNNNASKTNAKINNKSSKKNKKNVGIQSMPKPSKSSKKVKYKSCSQSQKITCVHCEKAIALKNCMVHQLFHWIMAQRETVDDCDKEEMNEDDDIDEKQPLNEYYCFVCGANDNQCGMKWTWDKSNNIMIFLKCLPENSYINITTYKSFAVCTESTPYSNPVCKCNICDGDKRFWRYNLDVHFDRRHRNINVNDMNKPKEIPVTEFEKECVLVSYDLGKGTVRKKIKDKDFEKLYDRYPADCDEYLNSRLKVYLEKKNEESKKVVAAVEND